MGGGLSERGGFWAVAAFNGTDRIKEKDDIIIVIIIIISLPQIVIF